MKDTLRSWIDEGELREAIEMMRSPLPASQSVPRGDPAGSPGSVDAAPRDAAPGAGSDEGFVAEGFEGGSIVEAEGGDAVDSAMRERLGERLADLYAHASESGVLAGRPKAPAEKEPKSDGTDLQGPPVASEAIAEIPPTVRAVPVEHAPQGQLIPLQGGGTPSPEDKIGEAIEAIRSGLKGAAAGTPPVPPASPAPAPAVGVAEVPGPSRVESEFRVPRAPLPIRLAAFGEWLEARHGHGRFFVADERGFLIHTRGVDQGTVAGSSALADAGRRMRGAVEGLAGPVHAAMEDGSDLSLIPLFSQQCPLTLGVLAAEPVPSEICAAMADALRLAVDGSSS